MRLPLAAAVLLVGATGGGRAHLSRPQRRRPRPAAPPGPRPRGRERARPGSHRRPPGLRGEPGPHRPRGGHEHGLDHRARSTPAASRPPSSRRWRAPSTGPTSSRAAGDRRLEPVAWRVDDVPAVLSIGVRRGPAARSGRGLLRLPHRPGAHEPPRGRGPAGRGRLRPPGDSLSRRGHGPALGRTRRAVARGPSAVGAREHVAARLLPARRDRRPRPGGRGPRGQRPRGGGPGHGSGRGGGGRRGAPPRELAEDADILAVVGRMTDFMMTSGNRSFAEPPDLSHPSRPGRLRVVRLRPLRGAHRGGA